LPLTNFFLWRNRHLRNKSLLSFWQQNLLHWKGRQLFLSRHIQWLFNPAWHFWFVSNFNVRVDASTQNINHGAHFWCCSIGSQLFIAAFFEILVKHFIHIGVEVQSQQNFEMEILNTHIFHPVVNAGKVQVKILGFYEVD